MKFVTNLDKNIYNNFVKKHFKSHFLQSYEWGEFSNLEKNLIPHYVGIVDEKENLLCSALLLEKKLPFNFSYFYSPRGFVIDFNDLPLLNEFVKQIKIFIKKYHAIFLKIDPDLIINKINYLDEEKGQDYDRYKLIKNLNKLGFKHNGYTTHFHSTQPRYTFKIDFTQNESDIFEHFSKTTKARIKKADDLGIIVTQDSDNCIHEFYNLMKITENRKDFVTHDFNYYNTLYDIFKKNNNCSIFLGNCNIDKMISFKKTELEVLQHNYEQLDKNENKSKSLKTKLNELNKKITKIKDDIIKYEEVKKENGNNIVLNAHFIINFGDMAWVLYAGNHNILTDTYSNYKTYYEHIKYFYGKVKTYDQFGTIGDIKEDNPLINLHNFKKKFGGDYVEFIGEFNLILNKFMYFTFIKLVPLYRNMKLKKAKKNLR